jgi:predicted permease
MSGLQPHRDSDSKGFGDGVIRLFRRLSYWLQCRKHHRELQEEIEFHRTMKREALESAGLSSDDALVEANRAMGNSRLATEDARGVWIWPALERFSQDIRYALRMFRRSPSFAVVAIVSLALGIGANSFAFTFVNALLFKPLPVERPQQLIWAYGTLPGSAPPNVVSYPDYLDFRSQSDAFLDLFAYSEMPVRVFADGRASMVWGAYATENFFTGLRQKPILGRTFTAEDGNAPGTVPVAVISEGVWRRQFGGDPSALGRSVELNGRAFTVIGVLPSAFSGVRAFGFIPEIWIPLSMADERMAAQMKNRDGDFLFLLGRMKPGIRIGAAQSSLATIRDRLNREYRKPEAALTMHVISGARKVNPFIEVSGLLEPSSASVMIIVGFVLLTSCANVANLILTRLSSRRREIAVRLALGASRKRLTRQFLVESLVLSVFGGSLGLALARWFENAALNWTVPQSDFEVVERAYAYAIDWRVVGFTLIATFAAGIVSGLTPALQATREGLTTALKGETQVRSGGRFRNALVVVQVALCGILLVCAGLSIRSAFNARNIDPGFATRDLLVMRVNLELQGYDQEHRVQFYRDARRRIEAMAGVASASMGFPLPLDAYDVELVAVPEGVVPRAVMERQYAVGYSAVAPGFLSTMQTRLVSGRDFDEADSQTADRIAIVNQAMARKFWPGENPIGKRVRLGVAKGPYATVIGVVQDGKYITLSEAPRPYLFLDALQQFPGQVSIVLRTKGVDPAKFAGPVTEQIHQIDSTLAVLGIQTIDQFRNRILSLSDVLAGSFGGFGFLALVLAGIGLYGVISLSVGQRSHEIGIRIAIGAKPGDVVRMLVHQSGRVVVAGCVIGVLGAFVVGRLMTSLLYGVNPADLEIVGGSFTMVLLIALLAVYVPARRAASADPLQTLRCD